MNKQTTRGSVSIKPALLTGSLLIAVGLLIGSFFALRSLGYLPDNESAEPAGPEESDITAIPAAVSTTPAEIQQTPKDLSALGGYDVLIADRGNNRLIEVTPDKRIVWEYDFTLPAPGLGADDAFFTDNGKTVIVNLEEYHVIQLIDYATKTVTWQYGVPGVAGSKPGELNTPDDAYKLPNGDITVADIKNCRILEIAPDKSIVRQYGVTGRCAAGNGLLNEPNGDTPLPNGNTLISIIRSREMLELDPHWQPVFTLKLPVNYPSDPQPTRAGNYLISDYSSPGKLVEIAKSGEVVWQFAFTQGDRRLDKPSLAVELPNGNILSNDDLNHRVIVIDKKTNQIVWQYGVTGKPGRGPGQLNIPDGMDIIMRAATSTDAGQPVNAKAYTVGYVVRSANVILNTVVKMQGYRLKNQGAYVLVSDESGGAVTKNDLPVTGPGIASLTAKQPYVFTGKLVSGGLVASNGNPFHFELTQAPQAAGTP